jgi:class 3 adenylate cyclase
MPPFRTPVNVASKLGEYIAQPGEILVSANAMGRLPKNTDICSEIMSVSEINIDILFHKIQF